MRIKATGWTIWSSKKKEHFQKVLFMLIELPVEHHLNSQELKGDESKVSLNVVFSR